MAAQNDLPEYTVPSLTLQEGKDVAAILQERLHSLNDLALTLKHIHWNVVGPHFIAVHEMIDPQVDAVRAMVDATAERIATLGCRRGARRVRSSPSAPGRTTTWVARRRSPTWALSTRSTRA